MDFRFSFCMFDFKQAFDTMSFVFKPIGMNYRKENYFATPNYVKKMPSYTFKKTSFSINRVRPSLTDSSYCSIYTIDTECLAVYSIFLLFWQEPLHDIIILVILFSE